MTREQRKARNKAIVLASEMGATQTAIGKAHGLSQGRVCAILHELGCPRRYKAMGEQQKKRIGRGVKRAWKRFTPERRAALSAAASIKATS